MDRTEYEADACGGHHHGDSMPHRRGHRIWSTVIENRSLCRARDGIVSLD